METPHTIELPLDHEGRLRELKKMQVSKFGIYILKTFADRVELLGCQVKFDELAKDQSIKDALKISRAGTRETSKALQDELTEMRRHRNRIAHTGGNAADVTTELLGLC